MATLEEVQALGFQTLEEAAEHQAWLDRQDKSMKFLKDNLDIERIRQTGMLTGSDLDVIERANVLGIEGCFPDELAERGEPDYEEGDA